MRDAKRCDLCGIMGRLWTRFVIMRDGSIVRDFVLCLACASDAEDAIGRVRRDR